MARHGLLKSNKHTKPINNIEDILKLLEPKVRKHKFYRETHVKVKLPETISYALVEQIQTELYPDQVNYWEPDINNTKAILEIRWAPMEEDPSCSLI